MSLPTIKLGQITTLCPNFIAFCNNFTTSLLRGSLSNIKTFSPDETSFAVNAKLASPEAMQLFMNKLSIGPSTKYIFSVVLIRSMP